MDEATALATDSLGSPDAVSLGAYADHPLRQVAIHINDGVYRETAYLDRVGVQSLIVQLERAQLELDTPVPAPALGGICDLAVDLFETASFAANMAAAFAIGFVKAAIK